MNILITGTSSGLGYELAKQFEANGDTVYGISRSKSDLNIKQIQCDLGKLYRIIPTLENLIDTPSFDVVILNAGQLGEIKKGKEITINQFENIFNINVLANKIIIDWLLNKDIKVKNIIGISTGAAIKSYYGWSLYCTSKAAFKQLIASYALENKNTHFISLAPGIIKTKMQDYITSIDENKIPSVKKFKDMFDSMDPPDVVARRIIQFIPCLKSITSGTYFDLRNRK
tara:strand:- start:9563 stop:10246 length:684 start_codon:yes stop_codon:yes gene_type:complete